MIKKIAYIFSFVFIISCGGKDDKGENSFLSTPTLLAPKNQFICLNHENIDFQWAEVTNASEYEIEVSNSSDFITIISRKSGIKTNSTTLSLQKGITYFWRVKALGDSIESEFSSIFQFYTQGEAVTNRLPKTPNLLKPTNNAILNDTQVNLSWFGSDEDAEDILLFDVYLGTSSDAMQLVSENQKVMSYFTENLSNGQAYFWRIAAKDDAGGIALSLVWSFNL